MFTVSLSPPHAFIGSGRTLRETVLESSPVLALLNQSFISSWSLVKELENLQVSSYSSEKSKKVVQLLKNVLILLLEVQLCFHLINILFPLFPGWWAKPCVEWKGSLTPWKVQFSCGDDGGSAQWNHCKYYFSIELNHRQKHTIGNIRIINVGYLHSPCCISSETTQSTVRLMAMK